MSHEKKDRNESRHDQPLDILMSMANQRIYVRLIDKTEIIGLLRDCDQYMNLKIEMDEEDLLIRGNNVMLISDSWEDVEGSGSKAGKPG